MVDKKNKRFDIRGQKPGAHELNRKLIITVISILLLVIVLIFIFSINSTQQTVTSKSAITSGAVNSTPQKTGLDLLPTSYNDANKINQIVGLNKPAKVVYKVQDNSAVEDQIKDMRLQQQRLERELLRVKNKPREKKEVAPPVSLMDRQAMAASIFFPGGAPRPEPIKNKKNLGGNIDNKKTIKDEKQRFMGAAVDEEVTNQHVMQKPISKYTLFAGTSIPGILKTTLKSDNPGSIVAIVSQDVFDSVTGQYLIIPKGSTLIGTYNSKVSYGDVRMQAKFIRLIRPDGTSIILPNQIGVDGQGVSGFSDEVDNHWGQLIGAAALTTVFNVPAVAAQYSQNQAQAYNPATGTYNTPGIATTFGNAALQSAGEGVSKVGNKVTERAMDIQPTLTIHDGYRFSVLVTKDIVLPPYKRNSSL